MEKKVEQIDGGLLEIQLTRIGFDHRTIADIPFIPTSQAVLKTLQNSKGWNYKHRQEYYSVRDRALVSLIYVGCLRISEVVKSPNSGIKKEQIKFSAKDGAYYIEGVKLVKEKITRKGKKIPRKHTHRDQVFLPSVGERKPFTEMILKWIENVSDKEYLFDFGRVRAWQITRSLTGQWNHYFRMIGENYLYPAWGKDVMSLSEYLKVDPRTLMYYLRGTYDDKPKV